MRAGELARLLALLPEDMPVLVQGAHIDRIYKSTDEQTMIEGDQPPTRCEMDRCIVEWHYVEVTSPAHIDIYSGPSGKRSGYPEPPVRLRAHGRARWPKAEVSGRSGAPDAS